eukprot:CAMPEP_0177740396 /NCGR_PEP_ID=MMETSP0484_2-20121128/27544_1 /TAXON_ID=354590 /ORGANISM="Rhodomonas lens, Strain RHODO" /LENGTH=93 /DNA_ID=CAMNT_0019254537 /DNA_START=554 /DNA_END=831 /DNA_ORIENTATION=+
MAFHVSTTVLEVTCETARLVTAGGSESVRGTTEGVVPVGKTSERSEEPAVLWAVIVKRYHVFFCSPVTRPCSASNRQGRPAAAGPSFAAPSHG